MVSYKRFWRVEVGCRREMLPIYVSIIGLNYDFTTRDAFLKATTKVAASACAQVIAEGIHRRSMFSVLSEGSR
jgi:hypothetical protein